MSGRAAATAFTTSICLMRILNEFFCVYEEITSVDPFDVLRLINFLAYNVT